MEEKKTLKIKKPYLIIFALAIAFAIMGVIDLKVNAAESLVEDIPYEEQYLKVSYFTNDYVNKTYRLRTWDLNTPHTRIALYYGDFTDKILDPSNTNNVIESTGKGYRLCVLRNEDSSKQYWNTGTYTCVNYDKNMEVTSTDEQYVGYDQAMCHADVVVKSAPDWKCIGGYFLSMNKVENLEIDTNIPIFTDWDCMKEYLETGYYDPSGVVVDYSRLEVDDNMTTIKNLKRNVIEVHNNKNSVFPSSLYDYLTWDNDMVETWELELQFVPVVQYYDINLAKNTFVKEFIGDWYSKEIFTGVRNAYLNMCFDVSNAEYITNNPEIYNFYADCEEKYEKGFFEESYLYFGYRFRYIDKANLKCSPWVVLMPSHTKDSYVVTVEYADNTTSDVGSGDGVHNKYENLENIEDAIVDVESENKFRDEYGITDSEINVDEAKTWLDTVSEFIKGTPQFIGATLSFLPKPILYGMYVCIFMSVVAVAVAIFKALI